MPITLYTPLYFEPIEHPRAQEARQKRMTVEQLLKLERKNQQSPGVVIEDKRDAYQNMRASVKNNPKELQRQKEGEAKAKENAAKAFNGILAMGMPSTYYNLLHLNNLLSNRQALALDLGSGLLLGGMGVATGRRALQKGILQSAKRNYIDLFTDGPVRTYGKVKYYGPTMGKTTASNSTLIDFDDVVRPKIEQLAKSKGVSPKDLKIVSDPDYVLLINDEVINWKLNPASEGKTLMISNKALSNPSKILFVYDNTPSIPSRDVFIRRLTWRGAGTEAEAADYYNALLKENPNLQLDNRFVSQIENGPVLPTTSKLTEAERLGIPRGERNIKQHGLRLEFIPDDKINDILAENFYRQESHELGPKLYKEPTLQELEEIQLLSDEYGIPKQDYLDIGFFKQSPNNQNVLIHIDDRLPLIVTNSGFKPVPVSNYKGIGAVPQNTQPLIWWNRNFPYYRPSNLLTYKGHLLKSLEKDIKIQRPPYQINDNSVVISEGLLPYEKLKGLKWNADQSWFEREIFMPSRKESDYFKRAPEWTTFKSGGKINYLKFFK